MTNIDKYVKILTEEINSGSAIVYHRTDNESLYKNLINGEQFIPGGGNWYGRGLYTTFNLESLEKTGRYGRYVVQFKINNLKDFFICDVNVYNRIHHSKMKKLEDIVNYQLRKFNISKNPISNQEDWEWMEDRHRQPKNFARKIATKYPTIKEKCNGLIYTGGEIDGDVLIVYPHAVKAAIPLKFSWNGGRSWTNSTKRTDVGYGFAMANQLNSPRGKIDYNVKPFYDSVGWKAYNVYDFNTYDDYWKYVIDRHLTNDWDEGNAYGEGKFYSVRNNKKPVYLVQKGDRTFYVDMNEGYIVRTEYSSEHSNSDYFDEFKNMPVRLGNMLKDKEGRTITDFVEFIKKAQEFAKKKYGEKTLPNGIKTWVQKGDGYNRVTFRDWFNKTTKHLFDTNDKEYYVMFSKGDATLGVSPKIGTILSRKDGYKDDDLNKEVDKVTNKVIKRDEARRKTQNEVINTFQATEIDGKVKQRKAKTDMVFVYNDKKNLDEFIKKLVSLNTAKGTENYNLERDLKDWGDTFGIDYPDGYRWSEPQSFEVVFRPTFRHFTKNGIGETKWGIGAHLSPITENGKGEAVERYMIKVNNLNKAQLEMLCPDKKERNELKNWIYGLFRQYGNNTIENIKIFKEDYFGY